MKNFNKKYQDYYGGLEYESWEYLLGKRECHGETRGLEKLTKIVLVLHNE